MLICAPCKPEHLGDLLLWKKIREKLSLAFQFVSHLCLTAMYTVSVFFCEGSSQDKGYKKLCLFYKPFFSDEKSEQLSQTELSLEVVLEQIDKLNRNKSLGPDNIHPRV